MNAVCMSMSAMLLSYCLVSTVVCVAQTMRVPVVVELFTSEGCSSCPPADALLARLEREQAVAGAEVIVLEEHVDYWDSLGWRDRFSSPVATERQRQYGAHFGLPDIYTPQMVVAGTTQFVGSDAGAASKAIQRAAQGKTYKLGLMDVEVEKNHVFGRVGVPAGAPGLVPLNLLDGIPPDADFYAALVSPHQATSVRAGENGGRTLQHVGVVRSLVHLGDTVAFKKAALNVSFDTTGLPGPLRIVLFAQKVGLGPILGAVAYDLPAASESAKLRASLK